VSASLFSDPLGTARNVDILNVQCGQRAGSKTRGAQQYDVVDAPWRDNEISPTYAHQAIDPI